MSNGPPICHAGWNIDYKDRWKGHPCTRQATNVVRGPSLDDPGILLCDPHLAEVVDESTSPVEHTGPEILIANPDPSP